MASNSSNDVTTVVAVPISDIENNGSSKIIQLELNQLDYHKIVTKK